MRFNMYFIQDGAPRSTSDLSLQAVVYNVQAILLDGGEITGIIDSEKD